MLQGRNVRSGDLGPYCLAVKFITIVSNNRDEVSLGVKVSCPAISGEGADVLGNLILTSPPKSGGTRPASAVVRGTGQSTRERSSNAKHNFCRRADESRPDRRSCASAHQCHQEHRAARHDHAAMADPDAAVGARRGGHLPPEPSEGPQLGHGCHPAEGRVRAADDLCRLLRDATGVLPQHGRNHCRHPHTYLGPLQQPVRPDRRADPPHDRDRQRAPGE